MNRTIVYEIHNPIRGQKVAGYLKNKGYSTQNLIQLKKNPQSIWVNDKAVFQNHILQNGDIMRVHLTELENSSQILPVKLPLDIIYEDEDLLVINKAAGMPIHPSLHNYDNSMGNALMWYFKQQNQPFVFRCINRLDRDTSGLTIVAKHGVAAGILGQMVAAKSKEGLLAVGIHREYLAIVKGSVMPKKGTIDAPIGRKESSCLERMVDYHTGDRAVTHYRVIEERNGHSLLSLELETGRTHQIRVHLRHLGFPLIGDYLYNPDYMWINRQALHAYKLSFPHPITGKHMEFTAPLPQDMKKILE